MESKKIERGTDSISKSLSRLNDQELVHVYNTLLESKWSTNDMWDEEEGISMDDWAESVKSEIEFVHQHVYALRPNILFA